MLVIEDVSKAYRGKQVLQGVGFRVKKGEVFGVLGLNGAGKTTLFKIISGIVRPSSGSVYFEAENSIEPNTTVVSLIEEPAFYGHLTGYDNLSLFYALSGGKNKDQIASSLEKVGMLGKKDVPYRKYSLGMKKRLYLAFAFMLDSGAILLDEPFNGLDVVSVEAIKKILLDLKATGATILISSHMIEELKDVADRVAILDNGRLLTLCEEPRSVDLRAVFLDLVGREGKAE